MTKNKTQKTLVVIRHHTHDATHGGNTHSTGRFRSCPNIFETLSRSRPGKGWGCSRQTAQPVSAERGKGGKEQIKLSGREEEEAERIGRHVKSDEVACPHKNTATVIRTKTAKGKQRA